MLSTDSPQITLTMIAVSSSSSIRGMMNVSAKRNFDKKVAIVDCHISFVVCVFSDSSEMWMPRASENASAIAIVSMPPSTTSFELVLEYSPIIRPSVVIMPDVRPKHSPIFMEWFIVVFCFFVLIYFVSIDDEKKVDDYSCYEGCQCPFFVCSKGYGDRAYEDYCCAAGFYVG